MFVPEHRLTNWSKIAFARSEILLITDRICFLKETGSGDKFQMFITGGKMESGRLAGARQTF